jgi:hypothetical protein
MKKFNNTLAGTDCGDAGLPAQSRDIAKAKTVLRVVSKDAGDRVQGASHDGAERGRLGGT